MMLVLQSPSNPRVRRNRRGLIIRILAEFAAELVRALVGGALR